VKIDMLATRSLSSIKAWIFRCRGVRSLQSDGKFKITLARIEEIAAYGRDSQVRVTFQIDRAPTRFQVPILLNMKDFDDTEMVQAARNVLHWIFVDLAAQTNEWKLTVEDMQQLSGMSSRPKA
jgi:hypothetical protein